MKKLQFLLLPLLCAFQTQAQIFISPIPQSASGGSQQIVVDAAGKLYYGTSIAFADSNYIIRMNPATLQRDTLCKIPYQVAGLEMGMQDSVLYFSNDQLLKSYSFSTGRIRVLSNGAQYPTILRMRRSTAELYIVETGGDNGRAAMISRFDVQTGLRTKVAGGIPNSNQEVGYVNGIGDEVRFRFLRPNGPFRNGCALVFSLNEDTLFIGDGHNRCIRKLSIPTGEVSTFAGPLPDSVRAGFRDGFRYDARFNLITGLEIDSLGYLYVSDNGNFQRDSTSGNRIRKITPGGMVYTIVGSGAGRGSGSADNQDYTPGLNGTQAKIGNLFDIKFDRTRDTLYLSQGQRISKITKRRSSLRFPSLADRMVGSGPYPIKTQSNSGAPTRIRMISAPLNVGFSNDTVQIPESAQTGPVILEAIQREDLDSIYTTLVTDTFQVVPFVSNLTRTRARLVAYPNPVLQNGQVWIEGEGLTSGPLHIIVSDALGRSVHSEDIFSADGALKFPLQIPSVPGWYQITIRSGGEIWKASIVQSVQ